MNVCPAKDRTNPKHKAIDMHPQAPLRDTERANYGFFLDLPEVDRTEIARLDHKSSQFLEPLFEYSGACAGCGETPYLKLLTQLFGDRLLIANATGLLVDLRRQPADDAVHDESATARGPAWSNSLFEDNAEFGFGFRLALDAHVAAARGLVQRLAPQIGDGLATALLDADQSNEAGIAAQRERVDGSAAPARRPSSLPEARRLETLADYLVKKSVWLVGGDGWAYDIGYGGLDHVLANRRDVNILVLDTEVYSNTGGQPSKATPLGAAAKFAAAGKPVGKKDLGLLANMYGHVYVAQVAFGAKMAQTAQAFLEAESYHRSVADHRLQPLHRPRVRHGARRVAAEAGGRLGRLAALPLRSAASRQGRAAAAPRLRTAQRRKSPTTCATSRASGWSSAPIPRATRRSSRNLRPRPSAATRCTSSSRDHRAGDPAAPERRAGDAGLEGAVMDLSTTYLGMRLPHPLIVGAGPLGDDPDHARALEDAGAAMIVLRSLYEEEITGEQMDALLNVESSQRVVPRGVRASRPIRRWRSGPTSTWSILRLIKTAVDIPVMASLNGVTPGGWTSYARLIEQAGADGLELHIYHAASDMTTSAADVERQAIEIVREVKRSLRIPGRRQARAAPHRVRAFRQTARRSRRRRACAVHALSPRRHRRDELEVIRTLPLSDSSELPLRLRGTAALAGRVKASIGITGASIRGSTSSRPRWQAPMPRRWCRLSFGMVPIICVGPREIESWMQEHEWSSLDEMRGNMSFGRIPDPAAYERANFRMTLRYRRLQLPNLGQHSIVCR